MAIREKLLQPEKLHLTEHKLINIKEESGCDKDNEDVAKEVTLEKKKNFTLKDLSKMFHKIESTRDKIMEIDPNLEKCMTVFKPRCRMLALYCKLYYEKTRTV